MSQIMQQMDALFADMSAPCCSPCSDCICTHTERVLRAYQNDRGIGAMPVLTPEQRAICLEHIETFEEGANAADWAGSSDSELADGVLVAWFTFCVDKGMV